MSQLAYDYTNEKLVDAVCQQAAKAGVSNSRLVLDIMARSHLIELHYLKVVLLSRLDGHQPPALRGDVVVVTGVKDSGRPIVYSLNGQSAVSKGKKLEITRTWYLGNGRWAFSFDIPTEYKFAAENFEKVT